MCGGACSGCNKGLGTAPRTYGAVPAKGDEWQIGRTAPSIDFVANANSKSLELGAAKIDGTFGHLMSVMRALNALADGIAQVKNNKVVLTEHLDVEEFLRTGFPESAIRRP